MINSFSGGRMGSEREAIASVFNTLIGIIFVAIAFTVLAVTQSLSQFLVVPAALGLGIWWLVGGTRVLKRYRLRALSSARQSIRDMDAALETIEVSGVVTLHLDKVTTRKISLGAWNAHRKTSLLGFADGTVILIVPVLLGAAILITYGALPLVAVLSGAAAIAFARDILSDVLGPRIGLFVGVLFGSAYVYFRRGTLLATGLDFRDLEALTAEQIVVIAALAGLLWNLITFAARSLTLFITSRRVADVERQFARELCASQLIDAVRSMSRSRAALNREIRQQVVEALGGAISAAAELGGSLDGDLDLDARVVANAHFDRFSDFLRHVQLGIATSSTAGWSKAIVLLKHDVEALVQMNYGELQQHQFPITSDGPSRTKKTLRRMLSIVFAILPLSVVLALPVLNIPLPATLYGPILLGFAVYAVVGVLLVVDPTFRERSETAQSALSLISSAANVGRSDQQSK